MVVMVLGPQLLYKAKAPKLPTFQEGKDDMDAYLLRFERYATAKGWNKETEWPINLSTLLTGKGLELYSALGDEDANNFTQRGHTQKIWVNWGRI